jgi:beta-mannosidase
VPGDIHWDLERSGTIPNLFYGKNPNEIEWIARKQWRYEKRFHLSCEWKNRQVRLCFQGVDYAAKVYLNGHYLGRHEGQFLPFSYDVTEIVDVAAENHLFVIVESGPEELVTQLYRQSGVGIEHQRAHERISEMLRYWKSRTITGWDWGTPIWTMGIWQDVFLVGTNDVFMNHLTVQPSLMPPYDWADLEVAIEVDATCERSVSLAWKAECLTDSVPASTSVQGLTISSGCSTVRSTIHIPAPRLWWPNGYGRQHLYRLTVTALDLDGAPLDERSVDFGIRDLHILPNPPIDDINEYQDYVMREGITDQLFPEIKTVPVSDQPDQNYLIAINGRKIFARGGNWLPCDLLYGRPDRTTYERLISQASRANFNVLRVWGGGLIEKQVFYELCDSYGIMVFQEMPHAGFRPPENQEMMDTEVEQLRQILPLLMNHPCIVRYGFGNELYLNRGNSRQMAQFETVCRQIDPSRPVYGPSPVTSAQRHGPHWFHWPEDQCVYNSGYPLTAGPRNPIEWMEYGAAGISCVETLTRILPQESLWPIRSGDPNWIRHKAFGAYGEDQWLGSRNYRKLFGPIPDLATEVFCSQLAQGLGLRYANQAHRRRKWHRSACTVWTFNEPWPNAAHGCIVEYSGCLKMAYYFVKQSYAPVDVSAEFAGITCPAGSVFPVSLWVTSDESEAKEGRLSAVLMGLNGYVYGHDDFPVEVPSDSSLKVAEIDFDIPDDACGKALILAVKLEDTSGSALSSHVYPVAVTNKTSEIGTVQDGILHPMLEAPATTLSMEVTPDETENALDGSRGRFFNISIKNDGTVPALFISFDVEGAKTTEWYLDNNFVSLLPGETYHNVLFVPCSLPSAPVDRERTMVTAKAWNSGSAMSVI